MLFSCWFRDQSIFNKEKKKIDKAVIRSCWCPVKGNCGMYVIKRSTWVHSSVLRDPTLNVFQAKWSQRCSTCSTWGRLAGWPWKRSRTLSGHFRNCWQPRWGPRLGRESSPCWMPPSRPWTPSSSRRNWRHPSSRLSCKGRHSPVLFSGIEVVAPYYKAMLSISGNCFSRPASWKPACLDVNPLKEFRA